MHKISIIIILIFQWLTVVSQSLQSHNAVTYYGKQQGLKSNYINALLEDKNGFIWIGSYNGIFRYDGKDFKAISKNKPTASEPRSGFVLFLQIIDSFIWSTGHYLARMNIQNQAWENYTCIYDSDSCIEISETFNVFKNKKNQIYLSTPYLGIAFFNDKKNRFERIHPKGNTVIKHFDWVGHFFENDKDELLFAESTGIVVMKDNLVQRVIPWPIPQNRQFRNRAIWFAHNKIWVNIDQFGLYQYDFDTEKWTPANIKNKLGAKQFVGWISPEISEDVNKEGLQFIKNMYGVYFDAKNNLLIQEDNKEPTVSSVNTYLHAKDKQNIWLGTSNGLYKIPQTNTLIKQKYKYPKYASAYVAYLDTAKQELYMLNHYSSKYLEIFNLKTKKLNKIFLGKDHLAPIQLIKYENVLYIIGKFKIFSFSKNVLKEIEVIPNNSSRFVNNVVELKNKQLLCSGTSQNVCIYNIANNTTNIFATFKKTNSPGFSFAHWLNNGNIMVSSFTENTLEEYSPQGKLLKTIILPLKTVTTKNILSNFCVDNNNNIWFLVQNAGLFELNYSTLKVKNYYEPINFEVLNALELYFDGANHIWIYSNNGIYTLDIDSKAIQRVDDKLNFDLELIDNGMFTGRKGEMLYATDTMLYFLNINKNTKSNTPYFYTEDLKVMGKTSSQNIINTTNINLQAGENSFAFNFGVVYTQNVEDIKYYSRILEINNIWTEQNNQSINYAGLQPGKYTLQLKAISPNGYFDDAIKIITINVKAYWYQTMLFKMLLLLLLLAIAYYIIRLSTKQKLQKQKAEIEKQLALEKERNRIASDMHDDLGAGLSKIRYTSSEAIEKTNDPELQKLLASNKVNSDELVDKMNDIIWSLNNKDMRLEDLIIKMRSSFGEWLNEINKELEFECDATIPEIDLQGIKKQNIYLSIKEAIHNSIKYANVLTVYLKIEFIKNEMIVLVEDKGKGFDVEKMKLKGNGLNNMHKRLQALNGTISINSNTKGTKVVFRIPL